jgi:NAD(P)-dependent dehydrogenase (short-subunit alcohol dehydrogenase family)
MKTIVITGSSSGIGKATAKYFAEQGWRVAATMRKPEKETELTGLENVSLYQLDVTDEASITNATQQILADFGTVDVVLNNAGYAVTGPFEAATPEQVQHQFDVNVFGLMRVTRAFLPHFRANGAGLFLNVSSMGGLITFPLMSLYHGTKWAVDGFSESLSYELGELGIQVKIIEPGGVNTDFSGRSRVSASQEGLTDYDEIAAKMTKAVAARRNATSGRSTAEQLAEAIFEAATDGKNQLRYLVGADAEQLVGLRKAQGDDAFVQFTKQQMLS